MPVVLLLSLISKTDNLAGVVVVAVLAIIINLGVLAVLILDQWMQIAVWGIVALDVLLSLAAVAVGGMNFIFLGLIPALVIGFYVSWIPSLIIGFVVAVGGLALEFVQPFGPPATSTELPVLITGVLLVIAGGPALTLLSRDEVTIKSMREETLVRRRRAEEVARIATEFMNLNYELTDVLSASKLDPRRVLTTAVSFSVESLERIGVTPPLYGAILLFAETGYFEEEKTVLRMAQASMSVPPGDRETAIPGKEGVLNQVMKSNEPEITYTSNTDPELKRFETFGKMCKTVACLPLRTGNENYGVLLLGSREDDAFNEMHMSILKAVANQAAASLNNAHLYSDLLRQRDRLVEVEQAARAQLASELHDGPTQGLAAITMRLNFIRKLLDKKPEKAAEEIYQIEDVARRTTKEIRHLLFALRPKALESGLSAGLEQLAIKLQDTYDQNVELTVGEGADALLDMQATQTLFSVAVETLNNSRKHSQASLNRIFYGIRGDLLVLELTDNGVGFDVEKALEEAASREGHLGLVNLQERAALIEGHLELWSAPGQGSRTTVSIPVATLHLRREQEAIREAEKSEGVAVRAR